MLRTLLLASLLLIAAKGQANEPIKHRLTGLFSPEREADLRATLEKVSGIQLVSIDFTTGEAEFKYDQAKVFPNAKPEQVIERFDSLLKQHSRHTFGVVALTTTPREKLKQVEIGVVGLDCKGCCYGAYQAIFRIPGVEQALVSFKEGKVTALIDPSQTSQPALEEALKQRGVQLKTP